MVDVNNLANIKYDPMQVQGVVGLMVWMVIGLIAGFLLLFLLYKLWQRLSYPYVVTVIEKLGKGEIQYNTKAKEVRDEDRNYLLHFIGVGHSQKWKEFPEYLRSIRTKTLGFLPGVARGFTVYKSGEKIIPVKVSENPGIVPIDYDNFNYMQWKVRAIEAKYKKEDRLMQMLPTIGLAMVVLAFVLGSYFWGTHIENVVKEILNHAASLRQEIISQGGQIIAPN